MDSILPLIIQQRMLGLGWKNYSILMQVVEITSSGIIQFDRQNEYLFLLDVSDTTDDFLIQGDNNIGTLSEMNLATLPYAPEDFTGNIIITKTSHTTAQNLLFARVIPKS